ncbi:MFS transporter [Longispora sp. K20-0274]|uniref:MFS transporter n=1 Tax=Longispora sp. K20-0274 TaxID=3088255 RepID=UPI0039996EE9
MASTSTETDESSPSRRRRGLGALLGATGISSLGDGMFYAAAPLAAAAITRDPTAVAVVAAAEYLPWLIVAPFSGAYVDRWPKRATMIGADLARAVVLGVLAFLLLADAATIPMLAVCGFLIVAGSVFHTAAAEGVIADLTGRDEHLLHTVNGRQQALSTTGKQVLGPVTGSALFAWTTWIPFAGDAVSFLVSGLLLAKVPTQPPIPSAQREGVFASIRTGARFLLGHRELRTLCLLVGLANLTYTMALATFVLFATDRDGLGIDKAGYGLLLTAMALGGTVGGLLAARVARLLGNRLTVVVGLLLEAAAWFVVPLLHNPYLAGAVLAVTSASVAVVSVVVMGARQRLVPPELLGRVISAFRAVGNGSAPLGAFLGGVIATISGLRAPMFTAAALLAATISLAYIAVRPASTAAETN